VANAALSSAVVGEVARGSSWPVELEAARRWASASPTSPVAQMAPARALLSQAWSVRGPGPAKSVSSADMAEFLRLTKQANASLRLVKPMSARDPSWYEMAVSIDLYLGRPLSESESSFLEAVAKEPEYLQTYFVMSRRFDPHWGGSADSLEAFVVQATAQLTGSARDTTYLRIYWWAIELGYFDDLNDSRMDCVRMMIGARAVVREYPDRWNTNKLAKLAGACGDRESAKYFLTLIPGPPLMAAWGDPSGAERSYTRFRTWLEAK